MLLPRIQSIAALTCILWILPGAASRTLAQTPATSEPPAAASSPTDPQRPVAPAVNGASQELEQLSQRLERVERALMELRTRDGRIPANVKDQTVLTLLESPYLGATFFGRANGVRFFVGRLLVINLTPNPITIGQDDIVLNADGIDLTMGEIPNSIRHLVIHDGSQRLQIRNLSPAKTLTVAGGGTESTWLIYTNLPPGNSVPRLQLKTTVLADAAQPGKTITLDINELTRRKLDLNVERIGPRKSLGLLTIGGQLDSVSVGNLMDELDRLAADKVARVVIRWSESGTTSDLQLTAWLQLLAAGGDGRSRPNPQYPTIPASIRELHFAGLPGKSAAAANSFGRTPLVAVSHNHATDLDAVSAALQSAYEVLPRGELLQEIEQGHPLTRAAALAIGGGRLSEEQLPILLDYADHDDPQLQRAALIALGHFGESAAVEKLVHYARKNIGTLSDKAIESLAGSRFTSAHEGLLEILSNEDEEPRKRILAVLAQYPRPIWSDTIYRYVRKDDGAIDADAMRALVRVGHPQLLAVLQQALKSSQKSLRGEAIDVLIRRTDPQSEEIAMAYTLEHLEDQLPTPQMYVLLNRTRDSRAIPLLLKHFEKQGGKRKSLINTLATIGDQDVAQVFAERYPMLEPSDKAMVLTGLHQMKSPAFMHLAGDALLSSETSLVRAACEGLKAEGGPEAVSLLAHGLEKATDRTTWSTTCVALSALGTPDARRALQKVRGLEGKTRQDYATNSLRNIYQRSPGFQFYVQGQTAFQEQKWEEAVRQFTLSVEADPELPDAYSSRASARLELNQFDEARADLRKSYELDPHNPQASTGLALAIVLEGKAGAAAELLEKSRPKFEKDPVFAYNAACVYSRAAQKLASDPEASPETKMQVEAYKKKALADLEASVKFGFKDFKWMQKDPDLKTLHGMPEFEKLHQQGDDNVEE